MYCTCERDISGQQVRNRLTKEDWVGSEKGKVRERLQGSSILRVLEVPSFLHYVDGIYLQT
jgi:hypothetical protein